MNNFYSNKSDISINIDKIKFLLSAERRTKKLLHSEFTKYGLQFRYSWNKSQLFRVVQNARNQYYKTKMKQIYGKLMERTLNADVWSIIQEYMFDTLSFLRVFLIHLFVARTKFDRLESLKFTKFKHYLHSAPHCSLCIGVHNRTSDMQNSNYYILPLNILLSLEMRELLNWAYVFGFCYEFPQIKSFGKKTLQSFIQIQYAQLIKEGCLLSNYEFHVGRNSCGPEGRFAGAQNQTDLNCLRHLFACNCYYCRKMFN